MTTTTTSTRTTDLDNIPGASFLPFIRRALEVLWLLTAVVVPLAFLNQDYAISESVISYIEVPKVALLRILAGIIFLLWTVEWAITSRTFDGSPTPHQNQGSARFLSPFKIASDITGWLKIHPTHWLLLAAGLFFGSTLISTVLSGSLAISIWGEGPGLDGYSAYTIASYCVVFAVITTHLKTESQLARLLGALVLVGFLIGLYSTLQHFGHDIFGLSETTGGSASGRATSFMGNAIFSAAVMSMTVPLTVMVAAINFRRESWGAEGLLSKIGQLERDAITTFLWASILTVQLLGLMFSFSRGPWSGAVLALVAFIVLIAATLGWRLLVRTGLVIGLSGALSIAFLHWQGSISILDIGSWLGIVLALVALCLTMGVLYLIKNFSRTIIFFSIAGALSIIVGGVIIGPYALSDRGGEGSPSISTNSAAGLIGDRISSLRSDVLGGSVGGRTTHWKVSWELIKERPWFEFDDLSLSWLRPLIGYGPDLFRNTYLLRSPAEGHSQLPLEPDHAHNFYIHQTVEQGIIGGIASVALFVSVFALCVTQILRRDASENQLYRLILFGLTAVILGRSLEMMVGVARISDLTILWVIFGLIAASIRFDINHTFTPEHVSANATATTISRNKRRSKKGEAAGQSHSRLGFRIATVTILVGMIGIATWEQSINSVRAAIAEGRAFQHFRDGNLESSLEEIDKAIALAPGAAFHHNNRATIFLSYLLNPETTIEPGCYNQVELQYLNCIATQSLESNLNSVYAQPFNFRARISAGNSAFNANLLDSAVDFYSAASAMVPNSWASRNDLAESLIDTGAFENSLAELDHSLRITQDSLHSTRALYLRGKALMELGRFDDAIDSFKKTISLNQESEFALISYGSINQINVERGVHIDIEYFNDRIRRMPEDPIEYYNRALGHLIKGDYYESNSDMEKAWLLGLRVTRFQADRAYVHFKIDARPEARIELANALARTIDLIPGNVLPTVYYAEYEISQGNFTQALELLDIANELDPELGLVHLVRAKAFLALGLEETSKQALYDSLNSDLPMAHYHVDRGELLSLLGEFEPAFSDLNLAIQINPHQAMFYNTRGEAYARASDFQSALADFNTAIQIDNKIGQYFINRGIIFNIIDEHENSLADLEVAKSLGEIKFPNLDDRGISYFEIQANTRSDQSNHRRLIKIQNDQQALRDIDSYSSIQPNHVNYLPALQFLGQAYLRLELWEQAADCFSRLIDLAPGVPEAYRIRGDAYMESHRYDEAIYDYGRAIDLSENKSEYLVARGKGYAETGDHELAQSDFEEAIRLNPDSSDAFASKEQLSVKSDALASRGQLSINQESYSSAFSDINHAINVSPNNHHAYFVRSEAHTGLNQTFAALKDLNQAITLDPTNGEYLVERGLVYHELEEYLSAIDDFSDAIVLMGENFQMNAPPDQKPIHSIYINRGNTYLAIGNFIQAADDGRKAIQILENLSQMPKWVELSSRFNTELIDAHHLLGEALADSGVNPETQRPK